MVFRGNGGRISRRQQSIEGDYKKMTANEGGALGEGF